MVYATVSNSKTKHRHNNNTELQSKKISPSFFLQFFYVFFFSVQYRRARDVFNTHTYIFWKYVYLYIWIQLLAYSFTHFTLLRAWEIKYSFFVNTFSLSEDTFVRRRVTVGFQIIVKSNEFCFKSHEIRSTLQHPHWLWTRTAGGTDNCRIVKRWMFFFFYRFVIEFAKCQTKVTKVCNELT